MNYITVETKIEARYPSCPQDTLKLNNRYLIVILFNDLSFLISQESKYFKFYHIYDLTTIIDS